MIQKYFSEVTRTYSGRPWSQYNVVPYGFSEVARNSCETCGYRTSKLKEEFVETVLRIVGFSAKYAKNKNLDFTSACERKRCLLDKLVLRGGAKAPSSFKKIIKPTKLSKLNQNEQ